jgi:hypothetical protein
MEAGRKQGTEGPFPRLQHRRGLKATGYGEPSRLKPAPHPSSAGQSGEVG